MNTTNESTLEFNETKSINHFLKEHDATRLEVIVNPNTKKRFFSTDNGLTGKVSMKEIDENASISVCTDEAGEKFLMLHPRNTENVIQTFTVN